MNNDIYGPIIIALGAIIAAFINVIGGRLGSKRKTWKFFSANPYFMLVLVLVIAIVYLAIPSSPIPYPRKDGMIANFSIGPGGPARNSIGETFTPILDSEYNGDSKCWYKLKWEMIQGERNGFLRLYYQLAPRIERDAEAYVGIFTDFSYPPPKIFDISDFTAISFRIRSSQPDSKRIGVFITLASSNVPPKPGSYDFPEYQVSEGNVTDKWQVIKIPLASFAPPYFSSRRNKINLDLTKVFRFALAIRSSSDSPIHGYLDIDDIKFE